MLVLRQRRILPSAAGTSIAEVPELTLNIVPVSPFSGLGPSGLNERTSRQVPVQMFGLGVDLGAGVGLLVGDQGAVVGARAVGGAGLPAGLPEALVAAEEGEVDAGGRAAASTLVRWVADQYSSCPTERKVL